MGAASVWAWGPLFLLVLLHVAGDQGARDEAELGLRVQRAAPGPVRAALAELAALPCVLALRPGPGAARDAPRVKWTKVRTAAGQSQELPVLVARDGVVRVAEAWRGRASLAVYAARRYDATLLLGPLRASDAGLYGCRLVSGVEDAQVLLELDVTGVVFHYRAARDRYALSFFEAQEACRLSSATVAAPRHLQAAFADGFDNCDADWLSDQTVRYPITQSRPGCYGDRNSLPGVHNYGKRDPQELYDVYCFSRELGGEVFYVGSAQRLSLADARAQCRRRGAELASVGQLHLAWHEGLDQCDLSWLADGSVCYPIQTPRRRCGGPTPGVRTVYRFANRTGFPAPGSRFDAYCFRAHRPTQQHGNWAGPSSEDKREILSAEWPLAREAEPSLEMGEKGESVTPDFQGPPVYSGEEPLVLAGTQASQSTPSSTPREPILALGPPAHGLPAGAVAITDAPPATSPSLLEMAGEEAASTSMPRRGHFKGLNGRHFQQLDPEGQPPGNPKVSTQLLPPPLGSCCQPRRASHSHGDLTKKCGPHLLDSADQQDGHAQGR